MPSRVNDAVPIVKMPVILASPITTRAVVAPPTVTVLNVETPTDIPRLEVLPSPNVVLRVCDPPPPPATATPPGVDPSEIFNVVLEGL